MTDLGIGLICAAAVFASYMLYLILEARQQAKRDVVAMICDSVDNVSADVRKILLDDPNK